MSPTRSSLGSTDPQHPIRLVAERTGLSPHVLRVWERRYRAVVPGRTDGRQRLYSDADVARLRLLAQAIRAGRGIGQMARLSDSALERLVADDARAGAAGPAWIHGGSPRFGAPRLRLERPAPAPPMTAAAAAAHLVSQCLDAVERMDPVALELALRRATLRLSVPITLDLVVVPLLAEIGRCWQQGSVTPGNEHLASSVIRRTLDWMIQGCAWEGPAPTLVAATPPRQRHELGAMMVAASAAAMGWRVVYLGPDLPVDDLVQAAQVAGARVLALSLVYPADDRPLGRELVQLEEALPEGRVLLVGGAAAPSYFTPLRGRNAILLQDLPELRTLLASLSPMPGSGPRPAA
jgi:DNA-binding transcriptional MerR regulator/methylmalonyl-CoA mutase cobalamin-binding subunit